MALYAPIDPQNLHKLLEVITKQPNSWTRKTDRTARKMAVNKSTVKRVPPKSYVEYELLSEVRIPAAARDGSKVTLTIPAHATMTVWVDPANWNLEAVFKRLEEKAKEAARKSARTFRPSGVDETNIASFEYVEGDSIKTLVVLDDTTLRLKRVARPRVFADA